MKTKFLLNLGFAGGLAVLAAGCASTKSTTEMSTSVIGLPKPDNVFVYTYAVSPDEVKLDSGVSAKIERLSHGSSRTQDEIAAGRECSDALADNLVKEIQNLGLPANRAFGDPPATGNALVIQGQFISIDEGNRTERVVIGLGAGRTDVKTTTQVFMVQNGKKTMVKEFETDAKSGAKPGAAETLGAGAVAGHIVESAVVTGVSQGVGEAHSATVEADAQRTAKDISKDLKYFFLDQNWIMP